MLGKKRFHFQQILCSQKNTASALSAARVDNVEGRCSIFNLCMHVSGGCVCVCLCVSVCVYRTAAAAKPRGGCHVKSATEVALK